MLNSFLLLKRASAGSSALFTIGGGALGAYLGSKTAKKSKKLNAFVGALLGLSGGYLTGKTLSSSKGLLPNSNQEDKYRAVEERDPHYENFNLSKIEPSLIPELLAKKEITPKEFHEKLYGADSDKYIMEAARYRLKHPSVHYMQDLLRLRTPIDIKKQGFLPTYLLGYGATTDIPLGSDKPVVSLTTKIPQAATKNFINHEILGHVLNQNGKIKTATDTANSLFQPSSLLQDRASEALNRGIISPEVMKVEVPSTLAELKYLGRIYGFQTASPEGVDRFINFLKTHKDIVKTVTGENKLSLYLSQPKTIDKIVEDPAYQEVMREQLPGMVKTDTNSDNESIA